MRRFVQFWLLAVTLLFGQYAGQLHALSHLKQDLLRVAETGKSTPAPDHSVEVCVAFHGVDSALPSVPALPDARQVEVAPPSGVWLPVTLATHSPFHSRAPPLLFS